MSPRKKTTKKPPEAATLEEAAPEASKADAPEASKGKEAPPKAAEGPKIEAVINYERQVILVSADSGDGAFRARAHKVGAPGYVCSDWVTGGGSAILPVNPGCTYRVGIQVQGESGRGPWEFLEEVTVPTLRETRAPKG